MAEINSNEILFKLKGAGINCFCQRKVSQQEYPEKKMFSDIFNLKLTDTDTEEEDSVKEIVCGGLWRLQGDLKVW